MSNKFVLINLIQKNLDLLIWILVINKQLNQLESFGIKIHKIYNQIIIKSLQHLDMLNLALMIINKMQ